MPDSRKTEVVSRTVVSHEVDRSTRFLIWAVAGVALMVVALVGYALMTGLFTTTAPKTAEEDALASTAEGISRNPKDGRQYAVRAETLHELGQKKEAYAVLDQGERAVAGENPALLYILRSKTSLLNADGRYAEAVKVGGRAMKASDDYLGKQGAKLASKGVTGISGNMKMQLSIDTAIQVGQAHAGLKQWDKAITMYDYALRLDPLAGDVLSMRGWAYLEMGQKEKARADFEQTLKYLPDDTIATRGMKQLSDSK
jgi:tetratricopeptide (TPR) repeat protein